MCNITNKFNILNETTGILLCPMQFVHALYVASTVSKKQENIMQQPAWTCCAIQHGTLEPGRPYYAAAIIILA